MNPRVLDALCAAAGAALGTLVADRIERRLAERRTLTESDQQWMASTHLGAESGA